MHNTVMAKGKSKRRIKDWHARYEAGEDVESPAPRRAKFAPREIKLGEGAFGGGEADELDQRKQVGGMITGVFRRGAFVRIEGTDRFCGIAKTFRPPDGFEHTSPLAVGDDVAVALARDEHTHGQTHLDKNRMDGMILSRQPRRTVLARPQPRSGKRRDEFEPIPEKVIAANMDALLIVAATAEPPLRPGLIERFLIVAERGELEPLVILNKIDLAPPDAQTLVDRQARDVRVLPCSAHTGEGLDALAAALAGRRCVLAGASGVGKSTLINAIVPQADIPTRTVRPKDQRGRHTTSQARVYPLPENGLAVDTPGVRELGVSLTAAELPWYFPEFEILAPQCKFRDCTHTHEPNCAIQAAVESGAIPPHRYQSYLRILESLETT